MDAPREEPDAGLVRRVMELYAEGWFPMGDDREGPTQWVQPQERSVLPLAEGSFHVPRTLAGRVRSGRFEIRSDRAFGEVIRACAGPRVIEGERETSTWITEEIMEIYDALHRAGRAHSVEAWLIEEGRGERGGVRRERLVGGLYGLCMGGVFCGESMFSRPEAGGTDASKVCLVHLVGHLRRGGFELVDAQIANPHTARFGFVSKPAAWYLREAKRLGKSKARWEAWDAGEALRAVPELAAR